MFKPMKPPSGTLEDAELPRLRYPLLGSYKVDGIRATVQDSVLLSSTLKPIPNKELQTLWGRPEFNGLDGEIIVGEPTGELVFNRTATVVMSVHARATAARFYVFDKFDATLDYEHRLLSACKAVVAAGEPSILMHSISKLWNLDELLAFEASCLELGYEGMMLRNPSGRYKQGRSSVIDQGLLRRKPFEDAEATITGTFEQNANTNEKITNGLGRSKRSSAQAGKVGKGTLGGFFVTGLTAFPGVEFRIAGFGTEKEMAAMWECRELLVGQIIKFKYQKYGSLNSPRLPIALGFRPEMDISA